MFRFYVFLFISSLINSSLHAGPIPRPNILFILADDLDTQYGQWIHSFPKLKSLLSDEGITFTNAFAGVSVCCPSRVSILTGRYAHNTRILTNEAPGGGFHKALQLGLEQSTIATWLKSAGYRTVLLGKYLNSYPDAKDPTYIAPGWSEWYVGENDPYLQYNYTLNENGQLVRYGDSEKDYAQDVLTRHTVDILNRMKFSSEPFFIMHSSYSPHRPASCARRNLNAFADARAPRPPTFNQRNVSMQAQWIQDRHRLSESEVAWIDKMYGRRMRAVMGIETSVQILIDALTKNGQLNNTYIVFASDNGYHLGQHRLRVGKNTQFEEDLRIPLIIRGPGVARGVQVQAMVLNNDFAPTFAELAGVKIPATVDGRSLLPLLFPSSTRVIWRQAFLMEHGFSLKDKQPHPFQGVHTLGESYVHHPNTNEREYYKLSQDPFQERDLANVTDKDTLDKMQDWLESLHTCSGLSCQNFENQAPN